MSGTHDVRAASATYEHLADVADLPEGALLGVRRSDGFDVCLFNDRGTIGAVGNECTHAAFMLSEGALLDDGILECAWHGARFDCHTGDVCRGPAEEPVPVLDVRVEDGRVMVAGPA